MTPKEYKRPKPPKWMFRGWGLEGFSSLSLEVVVAMSFRFLRGFLVGAFRPVGATLSRALADLEEVEWKVGLGWSGVGVRVGAGVTGVTTGVTGVGVTAIEGEVTLGAGV